VALFTGSLSSMQCLGLPEFEQFKCFLKLIMVRLMSKLIVNNADLSGQMNRDAHVTILYHLNYFALNATLFIIRGFF
jgi:hypothetical protein